MAAHTAATIAKLKALVVEALICWASSSEGGLRRQHNGLAGRGATAVWLRSLNYIGFHRVILRQSQPIGPRRSLEIARLHALDRKSTRLNSSHSQISYAVFCLKKKKHRNLRLIHLRKSPTPPSPPPYITSVISFPTPTAPTPPSPSPARYPLGTRHCEYGTT